VSRSKVWISPPGSTVAARHHNLPLRTDHTMRRGLRPGRGLRRGGADIGVHCSNDRRVLGLTPESGSRRSARGAGPKPSQSLAGTDVVVESTGLGPMCTSSKQPAATTGRRIQPSRPRRSVVGHPTTGGGRPSRWQGTPPRYRVAAGIGRIIHPLTRSCSPRRNHAEARRRAIAATARSWLGTRKESGRG
jgi:hypothetical protein